MPFCTEFPPGSRNDIENAIRTFAIGRRDFFLQMVLEIRNLSLCIKIFEHCHFFQNLPPVPEMISKFKPTLFHWFGYGIKKNGWAIFEKISPRVFRVPFYIVKHIRLNIGPAVRPFVSPSVRHWNLHSSSEPFPGSGLV